MRYLPKAPKTLMLFSALHPDADWMRLKSVDGTRGSHPAELLRVCHQIANCAMLKAHAL